MAENYTPEQPNVYQGKQIIINSDRVLFNAKKDSVLAFADKSIGLNTAGTVNIDTGETNNSKFIVNSPHIHLGMQSNKTSPIDRALLGDKTEEYLNDMLELIEDILFFLISQYTVTVPIIGVSAPGPNYISSLQKVIDGLRKRISPPPTDGSGNPGGPSSLKSTVVKLV